MKKPAAPKNKNWNLSVEDSKLKCRYVVPEEKTWYIFFPKRKTYLWFSNYWDKHAIPDPNGKIAATPTFQEQPHRQGWGFSSQEEAQAMLNNLRKSKHYLADEPAVFVQLKSALEVWTIVEPKLTKTSSKKVKKK